MLSLFCVVVCVLAQLINTAAQPAAILLRKRRVVGFIDSDVPWWYQIDGTFAILHSHYILISLPLFRRWTLDVERWTLSVCFSHEFLLLTFQDTSFAWHRRRGF